MSKNYDYTLWFNPKVTVLTDTDAYTELPLMEEDTRSTHFEDIMEFAGRSCYQSFHKPNPHTRSNKDYLANILAQGHESVLEHVSFTFYIEGVSRALTHELIRHRHLSYSQLSQRFVDESKPSIVVPPALVNDSEAVDELVKSAHKDTKKYAKLVKKLQKEGLSRKQAREAARAFLPNCTETKIVVTGNVRAWRDFLKKRMDPSADAEIHKLSKMIFEELNEVVPNALQDFKEQ